MQSQGFNLHNMTDELSSSSGVSSSSSSHTESVISSMYKKTLKIDCNSTVEELSHAIEECKKLLLEKDVCSEERLWLVRHIVELRLRVQEMKEAENIPIKVSISTMGHRFNVHVTTRVNTKQFCDHCSGVIWNIIQGSYICEDCEFVCHFKCINDIRRVCVYILLMELTKLEMNICPEKGLDVQHYKCAECQTELLSRSEKLIVAPRLCDYSGLYYCTACHWNDTLPIPARVIHNWDWGERPVSRIAYQLLKLAFCKPIIDIEKSNVSIFKFVSELSWIHKMRKSLLIMQQYLNTCHSASRNEMKLIREIFSYTAAYKHYSMAQLQAAREGTLENNLARLLEAARVHITHCEQCSGKGYLCEICGNSQVIFPFDGGAISCTKCNSLFHRSCWTKKGQSCPKCIRINERQEASEDPDKEVAFEDNDLHQWIKDTEEEF